MENSLLQTVKVKRVQDISQSLLKQANKDVLIKLVSTLTGSLARSNELLKVAAVDLDNLKNEHLQCQNQLLIAKDEILSCKNEQLSAVKSTVASEIRSWSDVVKENCSNSSSLTQEKVKKAVKSAVVEEDRLHNVMVFGLNEIDEDDEDIREGEDLGMVKDIMRELDVWPDRVVQIERVGEIKEDHIRPMKIRMERKEFVLQVLARSKRLKDSEEYSKVFLVPDRTRVERTAHKKLVDELKRKRVECPETVFFIKEDQICSKPRPIQTD